MKMKWFEGSIPEAIQTAKSNNAVFVVYINGFDSLSQSMAEVWDTPDVSDTCLAAGIVAIKMDASSEDCKHFSQIYPVVVVPCTFFIGDNGVPLEVVPGTDTAAEFVVKINRLVQSHKESVTAPEKPTKQIDKAQNDVQPTSTSTTEDNSATTSRELPIAASPINISNDQKVAEDTATSQEKSDVATPAQATNNDDTVTDSKVTSSMDLETRIARAKELIEQKQYAKAQKDKEEEKKNEVERRELGKNMHQLKQSQHERDAQEIKQQMTKDKADEQKARQRVRDQIAQDSANVSMDRGQKEAQDIKQQMIKDKAEEQNARQRVRDQIAQDRADRAERYRKDKDDVSVTQQKKKQEAEAAREQTATQTEAKRSETARLQFRLPDGTSKTEQFPSGETLQTVHRFICQHVGSDVTLYTNYPRRVFSPEDMPQTLLSLDLAPSAVLMVTQKSGAVRKSGGGNSGNSLLYTLLAPLLGLWNFIYALLFGSGQPQQGAKRKQDDQPEQQPAASRRQQKGANKRRPISEKQGNIHKFKNDQDDDSDENATWNGNSTQQL